MSLKWKSFLVISSSLYTLNEFASQHIRQKYKSCFLRRAITAFSHWHAAEWRIYWRWVTTVTFSRHIVTYCNNEICVVLQQRTTLDDDNDVFFVFDWRRRSRRMTFSYHNSKRSSSSCLAFFDSPFERPDDIVSMQSKNSSFQRYHRICQATKTTELWED